MEARESMELGVVVERRDSQSRWQDYDWYAVAVIPGAPPVDDWRMLRAGPAWVQFHAATLEMELHRKETEAYRLNLSGEPPVIYVVLRHEDEAGDHEVEPFLVTASPYEAQDLLDAGDDIIEGVPMPEPVIAFVRDFIEQHHVDVPFVKRKQKRHKPRYGPGPARSRRPDRG